MFFNNKELSEAIKMINELNRKIDQIQDCSQGNHPWEKTFWLTGKPKGERETHRCAVCKKTATISTNIIITKQEPHADTH
jgi:hypothetical protein